MRWLSGRQADLPPDPEHTGLASSANRDAGSFPPVVCPSSDWSRERFAHPRGTERRFASFRLCDGTTSSVQNLPHFPRIVRIASPPMDSASTAHGFLSRGAALRLSGREPTYHTQFPNERRTKTPQSPRPYTVEADPRQRRGSQSISRRARPWAVHRGLRTASRIGTAASTRSSAAFGRRRRAKRHRSARAHPAHGADGSHGARRTHRPGRTTRRAGPT